MNIIFPGMFREGKGQDMLIRAFHKYQQETKDMLSKVYLPGNGELLDVCKQLVKEKGLEKQVYFPGKLSKEEVLLFFDKSNILACTSKSETFSQVMAEGYCLGKCIVSTPVGIACDIIEEGKNGFIVHSVEELKNKLLWLNNHPDSLRKMGLRNYADREKFSWYYIAAMYKKLCMEMIRQ